MATDAQGRELSEDGFYYWDGAEWKLVEGDTSAGDPTGTDSNAISDSPGSGLENYEGDGSDLSKEQCEYLAQHLVRTPAEGPESVESVGAGSLSDPSTEAEWA